VPVLAKATVNAASRLGLRNKQLAEIIGTSEASVSRLRSGRALDPEGKEGELALLFLRLYRSLDALVGGDDDKARAWLHATNDHIRGIPAERIRTVEGLVDVVQYLDAMRGRL
jgi:transcriptional regulator with XRE-family HTH domain